MFNSSVGAAAASAHVRVITWNVYDLPEALFPIESAKRMNQAATSLAKHCRPMASVDAVVLTELCVEKDRQRVLSGLTEMGLRHHAELVAGSLRDRLRLSGIVVASRWPIESQDSVLFRNGCHGIDSLANKGAVYVRLKKQLEGRVEPINLFGTHFYVGRSGHDAEDRKLQAHELAAFMRQKVPAGDEIVLLAGDLNAPWPLEGPDILKTLGAYPLEPSGELRYTFVGGAGHLLSGSPKQSIASRIKRHMGDPKGLSDLQAGRKWVDYVAALKLGKRPREATMRAVEAKGSSYAFGGSSAEACQSNELSDHHPVVGDFLFDGPPGHL